jgi:hypothetical protein
MDAQLLVKKKTIGCSSAMAGVDRSRGVGGWCRDCTFCPSSLLLQKHAELLRVSLLGRASQKNSFLCP